MYLKDIAAKEIPRSKHIILAKSLGLAATELAIKEVFKQKVFFSNKYVIDDSIGIQTRFFKIYNFIDEKYLSNDSGLVVGFWHLFVMIPLFIFINYKVDFRNKLQQNGFAFLLAGYLTTAASLVLNMGYIPHYLKIGKSYTSLGAMFTSVGLAMLLVGVFTRPSNEYVKIKEKFATTKNE